MNPIEPNQIEPHDARHTMLFTCCIGMSKGSTNEPIYQKSYNLIPPKTSNNAPSPMPQSWMNPHQYQSEAISTTASALEDVICARLAYYDHDIEDDSDAEENEEVSDDPVQMFVSEDAHLLRCRPVLSDDGEESAPTIFGIIESATLLAGASLNGKSTHDGGISVGVTLLEPQCDSVCTSGNHGQTTHQLKGCCCRHPRESWTIQNESVNNCKIPRPTDLVDRDAQSPKSHHANVKLVDLTKIQNLRRGVETNELYPCFDTPGKVFHLLRSMLNCKRQGLHCASPWNEMYCNREVTCNDDAPDCVDDVVALLVNIPNQKHKDRSGNVNDQFWDGIEQREVDELINFRTGDAAPSYFLHSTSQILGGNQVDLMADLQDATPINREEKTDDSCSTSSNILLLVYRRLPPRDILSNDHLGHEKKYTGCLRETYLEDAEETELDIGLEPPAQAQPIVKHRMVTPPYQSHGQVYHGLLDSLLKGIDVIREEAQKIPQWTAWPEQNHYADNSWNIFPLCYTFPANDITQRKFIDKTCSFVPETTKLLQTLGPTLRTALFSRLDPRAKLGAHTGWSDLANHVLRVHIPLVVPVGKCAAAGNNTRPDDDKCNTGLCGTWVDGCVETHEEGRVVCFDDSKVHRAFNYSDEERIVLIVDLLRPGQLPIGTATGGHSDELDDFINGF
ncbi:hypothetical protein ACHAXR_012449 [Thalassiosira sp. AJA248-18]